MKNSPIQLGVPGGFQAPRRMVLGSLPRGQIIEPLPFGVADQKFQPWLLPRAEIPQTSAALMSSRRCKEKGCVFPAASADNDTCLQHNRQHQEPSLFRSRQPSTLLLDHAKFGVLDSEPDNSRANDRRRLAKIREHFLGGAV